MIIIIIISVQDVSKTENIIPLGTRTSGVAGAAEGAVSVAVIPRTDNPFVEDRLFSFLLPSLPPSWHIGCIGDSRAAKAVACVHADIGFAA